MRLSGVRALGLLSVMIAVVSSGTMFVRSGENITDCMKCHQTKDILNLYRECGGKWEHLLLFRCSGNYNQSYNPRILLDLSNLCWTLLKAMKSDSCVYKLSYTNPKIPEITTDVRVLDRVLSFNTTTNSSRLALDMAVSVRFSAGAVTWKVDGDSLQLINDNRTLIIHNVQRDDAERRFQVWITNPVSEEILDCQLNIRDPVIISIITCNISWLGEDMAFYLPQTSGYNAATWEVDGVPSDGYQLMEDDRMLIIPRNNTERSIWAGVTIPVGNEKWKYWLENRENDQNGGNEGSTVGIVVGSTVGIVGIVVVALLTVVVIICIKHRNRSRNQIPGWSVPAITEHDEPVAIIVLNGSVPAVTQGNGSVPAVTQGNGSMPAVILCLRQTDL